MDNDALQVAMYCQAFLKKDDEVEEVMDSPDYTALYLHVLKQAYAIDGHEGQDQEQIEPETQIVEALGGQETSAEEDQDGHEDDNTAYLRRRRSRKARHDDEEYRCSEDPHPVVSLSSEGILKDLVPRSDEQNLSEFQERGSM